MAASTSAAGSDLAQVVNQVIEEKLAARNVNGTFADILRGPNISRFLTDSANYPPSATKDTLTAYARIYVGFVLNPALRSRTREKIAELPSERIEDALLSAMNILYNVSKTRNPYVTVAIMQREFEKSIAQASVGYQNSDK